MKISIIGSGNMGRSLGRLWAEQGHEIFFGARAAEKGLGDFIRFLIIGQQQGG
jgi:predicted dinucleotide-binding enzyme